MTSQRAETATSEPNAARAVLEFYGMGAHTRGPRFRCWGCGQDLTEEVWRQVQESYGPVVQVCHVRNRGNQRLRQSPAGPWTVEAVCGRGHPNVFASSGSAGLSGGRGLGLPAPDEERERGSASFSVHQSVPEPDGGAGELAEGGPPRSNTR
jgi:hypothetical protein